METQPLCVPAGEPIRLSDFDASYHAPEFNKKSAKRRIRENIAHLDELGHRLYAENRQALLLVLQGMDTAGKDGTIRTVMRGINPQICRIASFKAPSHVELDHDFLWRIHKETPRRGEVGIFNRSHYEDVLVVRVEQLAPESEWQTRYDRINEFERLLTQGGITIVKCFLHVSKDEQRERLQARLDNPQKRWKFNRSDLDTRARWDDYQAAYEDALNRCNTDVAPWYIIPSDRKWYRNLAVSQLVLDTMRQMDPQFPQPEGNLDDLVIS